MSRRKSSTAPVKDEIFLVRVDEISVPTQLMRTVADEDALGELASSLSDVGLIQPIVIRKAATGFELVAGWRRLQAARRLGWIEINAIVRVTRKISAAALTLHENLSREDVNAADEARWVVQYMRDANVNAAECARQLRKSPSWVRERVDVAHYQSVILDALRNRTIGIAIARELAACDDSAQLAAWIEYGARVGWSAATAREWVRQWKLRTQQPTSGGEPSADDFVDIPETLPDPVCDLCEKPAAAHEVRWPRVHKRCFALVKRAYADMCALEETRSADASHDA